jgi:hypothetical protein
MPEPLPSLRPEKSDGHRDPRADQQPLPKLVLDSNGTKGDGIKASLGFWHAEYAKGINILSTISDNLYKINN